MAVWLKLWGTTDRPYSEPPRGRLSFGKRAKPRIEIGDQFILLGVGTGDKLVAVLTAKSGIDKTGTHADWPYECDIGIDLLCDVDRAPTLDALPEAENLHRWRRTRAGYRSLTDEQFTAAVHAIKVAGGEKPSEDP